MHSHNSLSKRLTAQLRALFEVDPRSLAFCRCCIGLLLLLTYLNFVPYIHDYFSDDAIIGRSSFLDATRDIRFNIYLANGHPVYPCLVLLLSILSACTLILNIFPRCSALASLLFFCSLTVSTGHMNFGLYPAMSCLLFWTLFLPYKKIPTWVTTWSAGKPFISLAAFGMILTALTICIGAGLVKLRDPEFWLVRGEALAQFGSYYTNVNLFTQCISWSPALSRLLTRMTVLVELLIVPALFVPFFNVGWRVAMLTLATIFFFVASLSIHVGVFPLVPLVAMYAFIPGEVWEYLQKSHLFRWWLEYCGPLHPHLVATRIGSLAAKLRLKRAAYLFTRVVTVLFLAIFALSIWNNYARKDLTIARRQIRESIVGDFLELTSLDWGWDFMYGSSMHNKFLVVEYKSGERSFFRNVTHVNFFWPMFNYEMNYANSIMNNKLDTSKLFRYVRHFCEKGHKGASLLGPLTSINLYEIQDNNNELGAFTDLDQTRLFVATRDAVPFIRYRCGENGLSSGSFPRRNDDKSLPIISWQQDFGVLQRNRSVDGNPIRLGGNEYATGIGTHANSSIQIDAKGASRFRGLVGIDGERGAESQASVVIEVLGDRRLLYRSPLLTGATEPVSIDLPLAGVAVLTLVAHGSDSGPSQSSIDDDHVSWAELQLDGPAGAVTQ